MANLKDIRKRIASVKSTQQITQAMKMVAASKLRRAQDAITQARPYADRLETLLGNLAGANEGGDGPAHPLLQRRERVRVAEVLVLSSDRGLCGGFNSNIQRRAMRFVAEHQRDYDEIRISVVGRKGNDFLKRRKGFTHGKYHSDLLGDVRYPRAHHLAEDLSSRFLAGELDAVFLLYNKFQSVISQEVTLLQLLPIEPPEAREVEDVPQGVDFLFEPSQDDVLTRLVPAYLTTQVWRALLESVASEQGARMSAMDSATRNAGDMIDRLTLIANRTRQAAITKELMEIVSGAEALK
ncbi:MAG: ATP synthase F1 subunit gamma [Deltaproteobacteria bacterium]|nr:ATP synthase F1 subunit gamma [Deltaproteobacteria bacterium]